VKKLMTAIAVLMVAAACSFVSTSHEIDSGAWTTIPTITRADTRDFHFLQYTREIDIIYMWALSQIWLPDEVAFCLYGHAADTTLTFRRISDSTNVDMTKKIAVIDSVYIANIKNATPTYVELEPTYI